MRLSVGGRPFTTIGTGAGLIPAPVTLTDVLLCPAFGQARIAGCRRTGTAAGLFVEVGDRAEGAPGATCTLHGAIMIVGGFQFGVASRSAVVVPRRTAALFVGRIVLHRVVAGLALPEILQTLASTVRNLGLATMGWAVRDRDAARRSEAEAMS